MSSEIVAAGMVFGLLLIVLATFLPGKRRSKRRSSFTRSAFFGSGGGDGDGGE